MDSKEEEKLRALIRKELENREQIRQDQFTQSHGRAESKAVSDARERIIREEIERFYRDKGGYQPYVNEDGDTEWLTDTEISERELQIPVDMEELETGQTKLRLQAVLLAFLFFVSTVLLFVLLKERTGSIQVLTNVPRATIHIDGAPSEYLSNHIIRGLSTGPHLISVSKRGYVPDGENGARLHVRPGRQEIVMFRLKPAEEGADG